MLFLLFNIGSDRFALDAKQVVEILPLVKVKHLPKSPLGIAGLFNYHGVSVPLIDLTDLALGRASATKLNTRIILTRYAAKSGEKYLLGWMAEQVMETVRFHDNEFVHSGISVHEAPFLSRVATSQSEILQRVEIDNFLPDGLREQLFQEMPGMDRIL